MIVVVPPHAAARVPVSNVSLANVPPNGISMWVWPSMPPGITYLPCASMTVSTLSEVAPSRSESGAIRAAIVSPSISTSCRNDPVELTTVPFWMRIFAMVLLWVRLRLRLRRLGVGLRAAVAIELPVVADLR